MSDLTETIHALPARSLKILTLISDLETIIESDEDLNARLASVEKAIETSRTQDLLQRLDSNTRRLDDLHASLVNLENQVQILNDKL